ncbi:GntR family transcriptional regulator [Croceivirga lutea]|uniref:CvfB family protein n=1 Tax=Croceivirga lutea TaxID=1775167 RepID=UPI0016397328|nr:S1-like domain-containing RNA-binding protein [Croceivirga lutea]GGG43716.1 GntR family transcriptional regulator [Croceivirga lutea]
MIALGKYNKLKPVRNTSVGVFLSDKEGVEILLPNKYVPKELDFDADLEVFCYLDHEERPVATTLTPKICRDEYGFLEVVDVNDYGAFLDWGLEKHLFVPYREQVEKMQVGNSYLVHCYLDEKTFRLAASSRLEKFLQKHENQLEELEEVNLNIWRKTPLGWEAIINDTYKGLLYSDTIFKAIKEGDTLTGYIQKIREDGKIDLSLQPLGAKMLEPTAALILNALKENNGFLALHDKSSPDEIKQRLGLSKKAFKKGVGVLYKSKKITLENNGIKLT